MTIKVVKISRANSTITLRIQYDKPAPVEGDPPIVETQEVDFEDVLRNLSAIRDILHRKMRKDDVVEVLVGMVKEFRKNNDPREEYSLDSLVNVELE